MKRIKILLFILIFGLMLTPNTPVKALYNTVVWDVGNRFYLEAVASEAGAQKGVSIDFFDVSYLDDYTLDVNSIRLKMLAGSKIYLQSNDRKLFIVPTGYPETICADQYSQFSYIATETRDFTITFSDSGNCPVISQEELTELPAESAGKKIDLFDLEKGEMADNLLKGDQISFIANGIMEIVTVKSVAASSVKIGLSKLGREYNLSLDKAINIDIDADDFRDAKMTLAEVFAGGAKIVFEPFEIDKVEGLKPGALIKIAGNSAVYYYGPDGNRYAFPNDKVYFTWYDDFKSVVTVDFSNMSRIPLGGLVTYRPGVKMIKFITSPHVYVVYKGGELRKIKSEIMAEELYGDNWNKQIDDINDGFFTSYFFGEDIAAAEEYSKDGWQAASPNITIDKSI